MSEIQLKVNGGVESVDVEPWVSLLDLLRERLGVTGPKKATMPLGLLGLGEIGITGSPAAIANAIRHATGKRVRDLPITLDKVL